MDLPQEWMTRDNIADLVDDEEADALNDETFGDGAGWDDVDPMNAGDISDLAGLTLGKMDVLKEAQSIATSESPAFPSLSLPSASEGLLGGGLLLTPGMFKAPAPSQDWGKIPDAPAGLPPPQQQQQQQQQPPAFDGHREAFSGFGAPPQQPLQQHQQFAAPPAMPQAPPGVGPRAMSLEDVERQMLEGQRNQVPQNAAQQQLQVGQQQGPPPGMGFPPPGMLPPGLQQMLHQMQQAGVPPQQAMAQVQQAMGHHQMMMMQQQQQQPQGMQQIMAEQNRQRMQQMGRPQGGYGHTSQPRSEMVEHQSWTRMTADEVNQILRLQNSMLRDAAATNVYSNMLAAKQGTRANFAGPKIEGRCIKLSEALEGALGKPAPRDLRRPRQLVQLSRAQDPPPPAEPAGGGEAGADQEGAHLNVPSVISTLPRAVRLSVENGMVRLLNVQDIDKIPSPDPNTVKRRGVQVTELYGLFHVNTAPGTGTIDADIASLSDCKHQDDVFFAQLVLVPKGCKLLLRSLHLLSHEQQAKMLSHILRCLLPIGYQSETHKGATEIEMIVQLLVKLVYSVSILALSHVLDAFLKAYSVGGTHLLICTKLGALALAALLRRGHDEYMVEEAAHSDDDKSALVQWAQTCQQLIVRCNGGIEPLFNAATQGAAISAIPGSMIVDAEVMVDFLYELGANANQVERSSICSQLAGIAGKKGDAQVQEQVMQLLQSLNWSM